MKKLEKENGHVLPDAFFLPQSSGQEAPCRRDRGGMARPFRVTIAIAALNRSAKAIANPLHSSLLGSDIK